MKESSHVARARHLHSKSKIQKQGAWVPHALTDENNLQRLSIAARLLTRHQANRGYKEGALFCQFYNILLCLFRIPLLSVAL